MQDRPVIFTPENEPYLGLPSLLAFDRAISAAMEANHSFARSSRHSELTELRMAATQIVPHAFSIALSIRELLRQGYLLSAEILIRPLLERVATLAYLERHPFALPLWHQGWPYNKRPSLKRILSAVAKGFPQADSAADDIVRRHNRLIHADPEGSIAHASFADGQASFSASKSLSQPERCDRIAAEASAWLVILLATASGIFSSPQVH